MTNFSYLILHILFVGETAIPKWLKKSITTQTLTTTQPLNLHFLFYFEDFLLRADHLRHPIFAKDFALLKPNLQMLIKLDDK